MTLFDGLENRLAALLVCPTCRSELQCHASTLDCSECRASFRIQNGVPVFLSGSIVIAPSDHRSNEIGGEFEVVLREGKEFVLHIGAGATPSRYPNCIEFEHEIFRHTDVVGDAHHLPFRDETFDRVFAFNVFEHLENPRRAAAEVLRVLKKGGSLAIHTAFLQPLHEAPLHFYNATEYGVRSWFKDFEVEKCHVSPNFTVPFMLAFLLNQVLESVGASGGKDARKAVGQTTLREWADLWSDHSKVPAVFQELQNLPDEFQSRISAGFELIARKP